jgi:hypothetical protein
VQVSAKPAGSAPTYFFLYLRRKFFGERGSQRGSKAENAAQNLNSGVWRRICGAEASLLQWAETKSTPSKISLSKLALKA